MNINLVRPNRLLKEIIFADGIGSSGKGMLSHILSCFERIEKQSNHTVFDFVPYIYNLNKISHDAAVTYLQTEADMQLYHIMMSRDVNFRFGDSTGVLKNGKRLEYFKRLFFKEGDSIVKRISAHNPILNEAPHDALRNAKLFFDSFGSGLKIIYVIREPFELILDWKRRGFGSRIGVDPREFQFSLMRNDVLIPMFLKDYDVDYFSLNEYERLLYMIHYCFSSNLNGYLELNNDFKSNVFLTTFNSLCTNTEKNIDKFSNFLNLKIVNGLNRILKQENLPRYLDISSSVVNEDLVRNQIGKNHIIILEDLKNLYFTFLSLTNIK
uniref:hypothetical protein n=1 Tax=Algoriphagus sp. TaxID=1872435 RepID=UPI0040486683